MHAPHGCPNLPPTPRPYLLSPGLARPDHHPSLIAPRVADYSAARGLGLGVSALSGQSAFRKMKTWFLIYFLWISETRFSKSRILWEKSDFDLFDRRNLKTDLRCFSFQLFSLVFSWKMIFWSPFQLSAQLKVKGRVRWVNIWAIEKLINHFYKFEEKAAVLINFQFF